MNIISKLGTAVAATSIAISGVIAPQQAQAGCYPATAAQQMERMTQGGASFEFALNHVVNKGYLEPSQACKFEFIGYVRSMGSYYTFHR